MNVIWPKSKADPGTGVRDARVRKMCGRAICSLQGRYSHIISGLTSALNLTESRLHSARQDKGWFVSSLAPTGLSLPQVSTAHR